MQIVWTCLYSRFCTAEKENDEMMHLKSTCSRCSLPEGEKKTVIQAIKAKRKKSLLTFLREYEGSTTW